MRKKPTIRCQRVLFGICLIFTATTGACQSPESDTQWKKQRLAMVEAQIEARGIRDSRVLNALRTVPRHRFVPEKYRRYAYADSPLPIGADQTISQPYIVALMTELAALKKSDKVLEVGTGSGYQAAILAEICDSVFTIEIFETLSRNARQVISQLGYRNVYFKIGDGFAGWAEHAPYDAIIVTCAPSQLPELLIRQLRDGGRIVIPLGPANDQNLYLYQKKRNDIIVERVIPVRFVPMIDSSGKSY